MDRLSMCRICLATDLRMDSLMNTPLQETYERLTAKQLRTSDRRPVTACYICCARLQNCYQLRVACLHSEEMFSLMLRGNVMELNVIEPPEPITAMRLATTPVIVESLGDEPVFDSMTVHQEQDGVRLEVLMMVNEVANIGMEGEVDPIKMEPGLEDRIKVEPGLEDPIAVEADLDNSYCVEPQPEIPVDIMKHDPGNTDPKPTPAMQRKYPQDATKRKKNIFINIEKNKASISEHLNILCNIIKKKKSSDIENSKRAINKIFTCDVCKKGFKQKENLKRHIRIHPGEKPLICDMCDKRFYCRSGLKSHKEYNHPQQKWKCRLCDKRFIWNHQLITHTRLYHAKKGQVNKISTKRSDLALSYQIENDSKCSDLTLNSRIQNDNNKRIQNDSKLSDKRIQNDSKLSNRRIQNDSKLSDRLIQNDSNRSDKRIQNNSNRSDSRIQNYSKRKIQNNSNCSDRRIQSDSKHSDKQIRNDSKRTDLNSRQMVPLRSHLTLNSQTQKYTKLSDLTLNTMQSDPLCSESTLTKTRTEEKVDIKCVLCNEYYPKMSDLTAHNSIHTGEKPFKCDVCSKEFNTKAIWSNHVRKHIVAQAGKKKITINKK